MGSKLAAVAATVLLFVFGPHALAFDLQAHRGGRGLWPENTLAAFERALELGVTTLEMDVAITSDGVAVISHDPALHAGLTRDAQGQWLKSTGPLIKTLTLAQVQSYCVGQLNPDHAYGKTYPQQQPRDGQRIPTLAAVFQRVKDLGVPTMCNSTSRPRYSRNDRTKPCRPRSSCASCSP
jgi:glycerophosphoryl diester phosphodiesterase